MAKRPSLKVKSFESYIDKILKSNVAELKIIENHLSVDTEEFDVSLENEDTLSLLQRFVDESEIELNKDMIKNILKDVHREACELV